MIELVGERSFSAPIERVFSELADLEKLVRHLPHVRSVKEISPQRASIVVSPGLSFIKGELETIIEKSSEVPPQQATLAVTSKGIGSSSKIEASFQLKPSEGATLVHWQARLQELGGLLKLVPSGLLKGSAQKVIDGFLDALQQRLQ